jgi:hypothetical protein
MVSPPNSHQRLCMSESRYGCSRSASAQACISYFGLWVNVRRRLTASRLCVRSYTLLALFSPRAHSCLTGIALISGCSDKPKELTPTKLPASSKQLHACENMINQSNTFHPRQPHSQIQPRRGLGARMSKFRVLEQVRERRAIGSPARRKERKKTQLQQGEKTTRTEEWTRRGTWMGSAWAAVGCLGLPFGS